MATDGEPDAPGADEAAEPLDEPRFQPVGEGHGLSVDDAYRVLAGLPPEDPAGQARRPARGYSRENAYRVLRGQPPIEEPVDGEP
jgi:hypothetical protein